MEKRTTSSEGPVNVKGAVTNHVITILSINSDHTLNLSDGGITFVDPGDEVTWEIGANSEVRSIDRIAKKTLSRNVFISGPGPVPGSSRWNGKIKDTPPPKEKYNIFYTDNRDGKEYKYDPVIQVNSRT